MRTTLNLDDDVLPLVKDYAEARSIALGRAVSELLRRSLMSRRPTRFTNGLQVFDLPLDSPRVTTELVKRLEAEND